MWLRVSGIIASKRFMAIHYELAETLYLIKTNHLIVSKSSIFVFKNSKQKRL